MANANDTGKTSQSSSSHNPQTSQQFTKAVETKENLGSPSSAQTPVKSRNSNYFSASHVTPERATIATALSSQKDTIPESAKGKGKGMGRSKIYSPIFTGDATKKASDKGVNKDEASLTTKKKKSKRTVYRKITEDEIRLTGMTCEFRVDSTTSSGRYRPQPSLASSSSHQHMPYYFYNQSLIQRPPEQTDLAENQIPTQLLPQLAIAPTYSAEQSSEAIYQHPLHHQLYTYGFYPQYQPHLTSQQVGNIQLAQETQPMAFAQDQQSESSHDILSRKTGYSQIETNATQPTQDAMMQKWDPKATPMQASIDQSNIPNAVLYYPSVGSSSLAEGQTQQDERSGKALATVQANSVYDASMFPKTQTQPTLTARDSSGYQNSGVKRLEQNLMEPELQVQHIPQASASTYQSIIDPVSSGQRVTFENEYVTAQYDTSAVQAQYFQYGTPYQTQFYTQPVAYYPSQIISPALSQPESSPLQSLATQEPFDFSEIATPVSGIPPDQTVPQFIYPGHQTPIANPPSETHIRPSSSSTSPVSSRHTSYVQQPHTQSVQYLPDYQHQEQLYQFPSNVTNVATVAGAAAAHAQNTSAQNVSQGSSMAQFMVSSNPHQMPNNTSGSHLQSLRKNPRNSETSGR